jgi:hypothetical protein
LYDYVQDSHNHKKPTLPLSSSNEATTSSNTPMVLTNEVQGNQFEGGIESKAVSKSLPRIKTMASALEESQLVGRENERSNVIKLLSDQSSQELRVISIWGMGGLGKTTLAKDVYQSQELINMFKKRAFVTVLRPFILKELLKSLVMQLTAESLETKGASGQKKELLEELATLVKGKNCLIVLDDLSSTTEWDHIINSFPKQDAACKILVTTREYSIAKQCSGKQDNICELKVLEDNDALNLFTKKVLITHKHVPYPCMHNDVMYTMHSNRIFVACGNQHLYLVCLLNCFEQIHACPF